MSSRFVFCFSATCSLTSCPSDGPDTSSRTTVNPGMFGGIFGWSQHVVGALDCSLFGHATDSRASKPTRGIVATLRGRVGARIRDLLGIGATLKAPTLQQNQRCGCLRHPRLNCPEP